MKAIKLKRIKPVLTFVLISLISINQVLAVEPGNNDSEAVSWYQIEIILFKNKKEYEQDKEHIAIDMTPLEQKLVLVSGKPMVNSQLQRLDPSELKLNKSFKAMTRSKDYEVLEFAGWKQALIKEQPGIPLVITSGAQHGKHHELEGKLTFRRSRYLHLHADLYMADYTQGANFNLQSWLLEDDNVATRISQLHNNRLEQSTTEDNTTNILLSNSSNSNPETTTIEQESSDLPATLDPALAEATYIATNIAHMNETRRMRSGEIHYLDHPKFGLLVTIEPTDPPFVYNER
ncbi:CsiV family protein [Alkalimarinus sediminis]|uniref:Peptidoglycan binding protein CsiV n=1 Tax=Alkalimarinus sediminis TaxID=1632866 RepID=A0A9E8HLI7_9ALTE|nr:CsiV family protein [Alkalimarinus sediminis]UZW76525.1 peptidoglycan binding protein CsiV [Alkalimarinus sediminis]